MHKYRIGRALGEGSFAVVHEAYSADGTRVAVKKLKQPAASWEACMRMRELRSFKTAGRHVNIVALLEVVLEKPTLSFVFEFLDSNLHQVICAEQKPFEDARVRRMGSDLLSGLQHLHSRGFMHRDLKRT